MSPRKIRLKYEGRCCKCGKTIPIGTKACWESGKGVWHLDCKSDRNGNFALDKPPVFKRRGNTSHTTQPSKRFSSTSMADRLRIPRSTQLGLLLALVTVLAFGGIFLSTNIAPPGTSPTETKSSYVFQISHVTPTYFTTETSYVAETSYSIHITTSGTKTTPPSRGMFVGSRLSDIYHWPSCYWAKQIHPHNEIWFKDSADARAHGYRPCKVCRPP